MGYSTYKSSDFEAYSKSVKLDSMSVDQIYSSKKIAKDLDPKGVKFRESVDSAENPNSTAVILGLDVTGSMEGVLSEMAKNGLNTVAKELHEKQLVSNPHTMCMGIGDISYDTAPLQVTQFEADLLIIQQLEKLYFEKGGGGNQHESYTLPWYFAAYHTKIDCWDKRQKKGYLFTIGDEEPNLDLDKKTLSEILGYEVTENLDSKSLLAEVSKRYEVYHLMVQEGMHYHRYPEQTRSAWTALLGQRAIPLKDDKRMAEVILTTIAVNEGKDPKHLYKGWKDDAATLDAMSGVFKHFNRVLDLT